MLKAERIDRIFEIIKENKYITVDELVNRVHYSPATIRRDLTQLEKLGLIKKSYGGVCFNERLRPTIIREHENIADKIDLCNRASDLIKDGDMVFIDGTTTTYFLHDLLIKKKNITVVTTNLKLAIALGEKGVECIVSGGKVHDTNYLKSSLCSELLKKMRFNVAFFSCSYISPDGEVDVWEEFRPFYETVLERSSNNVLICDAHKFKDSIPLAYCELDTFNTVITNGDFPSETKQKFPKVKFI